VSSQDLVFPLIPRQRVLGLPFGPMHSARRGLGSDVAGSRPYNPGDDVDAIDWAASAKLSAARSSDEFIVRERFAEEAPRVVVVADRRPAMELFPPEFPWLSKPDAAATALEAIAASTFASRGLFGYVDLADELNPDPELRTEEVFWRPPRSQTAFRRFESALIRERPFFAEQGSLDRALGHLLQLRGVLPAGTFVFVLADFLDPPGDEVWLRVLERRWDVVAVVIQDPLWERSFPDVSGVAVPIVNAESGKPELLRLTAAEARARRVAHEQRFDELATSLPVLGVDVVAIDSSDELDVLSAFLEWADGRTGAAHAAMAWGA
jgi:uncharacterized protein (DUF58 family)